MTGQARLLGEDGPGKQEYRARTKNGYFLDEVASALQKEVRRGNEDAALYWALELVEGGYGNYMWQRLGVMVGEEIGLADPMAYPVIAGMWQLYERRVKKWSEGPHTLEILGAAILYMCRAPKNKEAGMAAAAVAAERAKGRREPVPEYARDFHTRAGREKLEAAGVSKEEQSLLWWMSWAHCENVKPGNRWLKRVFGTDDWLGDESREQVYSEYLKLYEEAQENQL
jgi:replication-associated recombination protein RarA